MVFNVLKNVTGLDRSNPGLALDGFWSKVKMCKRPAVKFHKLEAVNLRCYPGSEAATVACIGSVRSSLSLTVFKSWCHCFPYAKVIYASHVLKNFKCFSAALQIIQRPALRSILMLAELHPKYVTPFTYHLSHLKTHFLLIDEFDGVAAPLLPSQLTRSTMSLLLNVWRVDGAAFFPSQMPRCDNETLTSGRLPSTYSLWTNFTHLF